LGFAINKIAPAMVKLGTGATFAHLYAALTSAPQAEAWTKFLAAAKALPKIVNDDPFATTAKPKKKKKKGGSGGKTKSAAGKGPRRSRK